MRLLKAFAIAGIGLSLAACDQGIYNGGMGGMGPKQTVGTGVGALAGGVIGSQFGGGEGRLWATGAGVLIGALMGSEVGKSLDRADRAYMGRATYSALENNRSGQTSRWDNPDSGHYGTITPQPAYSTSSGRPCREYTQTIYIDGRSQQAHGTACRMPDGSWQIQN